MTCAWQSLGFSRELSFVAPPAVGRGSTVRFLAVADLGHTQTDGSAEINHDQAHDLLNYTPVDTLQHVRPHRLLHVFRISFACRQAVSALVNLNKQLFVHLDCIPEARQPCVARSRRQSMTQGLLLTRLKLPAHMGSLIGITLGTLGVACSEACCGLCAQVFELFYDFLVDSEVQQGASLYTLKGLMGSAANASLLLLNGDVSYARHAPSQRQASGSSMPLPPGSWCSRTSAHHQQTRKSLHGKGEETSEHRAARREGTPLQLAPLHAILVRCRMLTAARCECRGQLTQWDVFMREMEPLASQIPWMLTEGVSHPLT